MGEGTEVEGAKEDVGPPTSGVASSGIVRSGDRSGGGDSLISKKGF